MNQRMYLRVFVILGSALNCVSLLTLSIEPKRAHIKTNQPLTIMCKAQVALKGCQFSWRNKLVLGPIIDLSLGAASTTATISTDVTRYSYFGSGLQTGECGLNVTIARFGSRVIGCRARTDAGNWVYAELGIQVDSQNAFTFNVNPYETVLNVGDNVNLACVANEPLRECQINLPSGSLTRFTDDNMESEMPGVMRYFGTGLQNGQCGVTLYNVSEATNGRVICAAKTTKKREYEVSSIAVIIAQAPADVRLDIKHNPIPNGGNLQATCNVGESRPSPKITWYLGSDKIREGNDDDSNPSDKWVWNIMSHSISQTITRPVTSRDNGKELRCEVDHEALPNRLVQTRVLSVDAPPSCPPLNSNTLNIICVANGTVGCVEPLLPGTVAYLYCKTGYVLAQPRPDYHSVTCQEDGTWNKNVFECILDCGKRMIKDGATLISNGVDATIGEFPWHIAIYQKVGNQSYAHICGGTLLKEDLVVSAAHCFWNVQTTSKNSPSLYKIAAGKHYREWTVEREPEPPQKRDVQEIFIPHRYTGRESNFVQDIALLRLSSPLDITKEVNVVCIDWENEREQFALEPNNNGTVPGWGFTESGLQSEELKVVDLPFISFHTCRKAVPPVQRPILTPDKFCAGYVNKSISVCGGDSGGGMVFLDGRYERYFIRGIVSVAFKPFDNTDICFSQLYTAFTQFSKFISWIRMYY